MAKKKLSLITQGSYVILDNGLVRLTILKPQGYLTGIKYGGMDNLLDLKSNESSRGYWDVNWSLPGGQDRYQLVSGAEYSVIHRSNDQIEVSFKKTYNPSTPGHNLPLSIDTRYALRSDVTGFNCYAIYEVPPGSPAFDLAQTRMVFKLRREKFHYITISDQKQRVMPMPEDLLPGRGKQLIVPESVLLVNPINPDLKGEVDDKYQYSMDNKDGGVHGWISSDPIIGFWVIFPSNEFRNGGPTKQELTVHTGPNCLAMFHGTHFIGDDILAHFQDGETWRKVFGPFFVYLNSTPNVSNAYNLWIDAKKQRLVEEAAWPYDFVSTPYYLTAKERGSATGRLFVQERFVSGNLIPAKYAYVGLSAARTEGAWQTESKGYQFWVQTDANGNFTIKNVIPGVYGLHGWVPGFIGDYLDNAPVTISAGSNTLLGNLTYTPIRDGPTVWEIGFPDRTAIGFYVPDVNPMYVNKLFKSHEKFRQYGLWDRYTDIYPDTDQIFTIGVSDPKKDWFFAHVDRRGADNEYLPTTWTIKFNIDSVISGTYKLRLAMASVTRTDLKVHVNVIDTQHLVFQVMNLGTDNAICRHGIHGLYRFYSIDIPSTLLVKGDNSLFLVLARGGDSLCGILYDYMRLEAPASSGRIKEIEEQKQGREMDRCLVYNLSFED
ncbi:rhamnogalacturonate lyase-like [Tripterygium wilfordii]|uniref:rhamnogalacturonate lyase-like n=1 Tax=Tripterygium wilfordii TaxID=458696 RepID=UPI0018F84EEB|nr:rhamnogalacturonate lyase-like [Tripterygium wilfordii]